MLQAQNTQVLATKCLIAVGSNRSSPVGSVSQTVAIALELLADSESIEINSQSRFFRTPAYPVGSGPEFVNAVVEISTCLPPQLLLKLLHQIEAHMGRTRTSRWEARVLDMDLLACGDLILPDIMTFDRWMKMPETMHSTLAPDELILPHPRLQNRGFVLVPLADIASDWMHPRLGLTVRQMLADLSEDDLDGIIPLESSGALIGAPDK